jgi:hypothetical protein
LPTHDRASGIAMIQPDCDDDQVLAGRDAIGTRRDAAA